jgi:hypothetical protein
MLISMAERAKKYASCPGLKSRPDWGLVETLLQGKINQAQEHIKAGALVGAIKSGQPLPDKGSSNRGKP